MTLKLYLTFTLLMASGLTLALPQASSNSTSSTSSGPSGAQVTSQAAFSSGAGNNNADLSAGVAGSDSYTCYNGGWQNFPDHSKWVSFTDMFNSNKASMKSQCSGLNTTADTDDQIGYVYNAIMEVSKASLVDPRYILATVMQESFGCVNVGTTYNGQTNPGIMQSAKGTSFVGNSKSADEQQASVTQMVVDGTQGTSSGPGLVQGINIYGNIYEAARYYNSGSVDKSDLNNKMGATPSYVSDIANRLTGWVNANSQSCS